MGGVFVLSNQILHRTAQDIREITGLECSVWDVRGTCLVRTSEKAIEMEQDVRAFCASIRFRSSEAKRQASM